MGTFKNEYINEIEGSIFSIDTFGEEVLCMIPNAPKLTVKAIINKNSFNLDTEGEGFGAGQEVTFLTKELPAVIKKNDEFSINGFTYRVEDILSRTKFFTRLLLRIPYGKRH